MKCTISLVFVALAACTGEQGSSSSSLTRSPGECGSIESHVIGVHDAGPDATVVISRPGKHVLVLSSYEATTWHVSAENGAVLEHIYAVGYHAQKVHVAGTVDVKTESFDQNGTYACGYEYPSGGACDTQGLLKLAAVRTHHDVTSFHGCYSASHWTIGKDLAVTSDCAATTSVQADAITRCDSGGGDGSCGNGGGGSGGGDGSGGGGSGSDNGNPQF